MTGESAGGDTRQYEYNVNDMLTMVTDENGRLTTYEYDKSRNHTGTTYANGDYPIYSKGLLIRLILVIGIPVFRTACDLRARLAGFDSQAVPSN